MQISRDRRRSFERDSGVRQEQKTSGKVAGRNR